MAELMSVQDLLLNSSHQRTLLEQNPAGVFQSDRQVAALGWGRQTETALAVDVQDTPLYVAFTHTRTP